MHTSCPHCGADFSVKDSIIIDIYDGRGDLKHSFSSQTSGDLLGYRWKHYPRHKDEQSLDNEHPVIMCVSCGLSISNESLRKALHTPVEDLPLLLHKGYGSDVFRIIHARLEYDCPPLTSAFTIHAFFESNHIARCVNVFR